MIGIYARQSVLNEDSLSIEDQIEQCKRFVTIGESFKVYKDGGYSGKDIERPEFGLLMRDIELGLISEVIVYKLDRFSRSVADFSRTMEIFKEHDIKFSTTDGLSNKDGVGELLLSVFAAFAQMERNNIIARVSDNYKRRASKGYFLGGVAPFGFLKEEFHIDGKKTSRLIPDESIIDIVKEMFQRYAYDETVTLGILKRWLDSCGVKTGKGLSWTSAAMSRILRNPVYVRADADIYTYLHDIKGASHDEELKITDFTGEYGCYTYTLNDKKVKEKNKDKFSHLDKCHFTIAPHQGIIDSETWLRCQYRLDKNKKFKGDGKGSYSWLSGIMKCGYCGYAMTVTNDKKRDTYYLNCGGRKKGICFERKKSMQAFELEAIVEVLLFERMRKIKAIQRAEPIQDGRKVNDLKVKIIEVEQAIQRLTHRMILVDDLGAVEIGKAINRNAEEKSKLSHQLDEAMREQQDKNFERYNIDEYIENWQSYDIETKKKIARIFIDKVMVDDEKILPLFK